MSTVGSEQSAEGGLANYQPPLPGRQEGEVKRGEKRDTRAVEVNANYGTAQLRSPIAHRYAEKRERERERRTEK